MDRERIIVLKKTVYRDSDLIIRGLNAQGAKLSFIALAALKSRRRFGGGVLEPTNFIEVIYQGSQRSTLPRLLEAQVIKEFQGLRRNYDLIQMGLNLLELVDRVSHDGIQHGEDLFNLLGHGLQCLAQMEEEPPLFQSPASSSSTATISILPPSSPSSSSLVLFRLQFLLKFLFQQGVLEIEPWMNLFLRTPLRDHKILIQTLEQEVEAQESESITGVWASLNKSGKNTPQLSSLILDRLMIIEYKVKAYKETGSML